MQAYSPIVLTGATGFIGRRVLAWFGADTPVTTIEFQRWAIEQEQSGVNRSSAAGSVLASLRDATLVHLAWCPPVRDRFQPHAEQVALLARFLEEYGSCIGRVVAVGSGDEYGFREGRLVEVDAVHENLSPYGWGKRAAQIMLEAWGRLHGKPVCWLRPFLVYGEGQHGNMAIPYALRQARQRQVATFSTGTQLRDFIHVDDVARGIGLAATTSWQGARIINLGTGIGTPLRSVLEQIARDFRVVELFRFGVRPKRPGEPETQIAATDAARDILGFEARIPLEEGLRRLLCEKENCG